MNEDIIEQYIEEIEKDTKFNQFTIKEVQMKLPGIKHKWVARLIRHKRSLNRLYAQRSECLDGVTQKIQENSPFKVTSTTAQKTAVKSKSVKEINDLIENEKLVIELLERAEKIFSSMSFDVKGAIQIMQLETM